MNFPTVTPADISIGPGVIYMGAAGTTPTLEVGTITVEDGVKLKPTMEREDILAGNPAMIAHSLVKAAGFGIEFTGVEWDFDLLAYALGSGITTGSSTLGFGGDPNMKQVAIEVHHRMAGVLNTMIIRLWKGVADSAPEITMGMDAHKFPMSFVAQRSATSWSGAALAAEEQLVQFFRQT